jgi:hypothetical protein
MREATDGDVDPVVEAYKPGVDVTLIDRNLGFTPEERLVQLMEMQRFAEELANKRAVGRPKDLEVIAELELILDRAPQRR